VTEKFELSDELRFERQLQTEISANVEVLGKQCLISEELASVLKNKIHWEIH